MYVALLLLRCSARKGEVHYEAGPTAMQRREARATIAEEAAAHQHTCCCGALGCGEGSRAGRLASLLWWDIGCL